MNKNKKNVLNHSRKNSFLTFLAVLALAISGAMVPIGNFAAEDPGRIEGVVIEGYEDYLTKVEFSFNKIDIDRINDYGHALTPEKYVKVDNEGKYNYTALNKTFFDTSDEKEVKYVISGDSQNPLFRNLFDEKALPKKIEGFFIYETQNDEGNVITSTAKTDQLELSGTKVINYYENEKDGDQVIKVAVYKPYKAPVKFNEDFSARNPVLIDNLFVNKTDENGDQLIGAEFDFLVDGSKKREHFTYGKPRESSDPLYVLLYLPEVEKSVHVIEKKAPKGYKLLEKPVVHNFKNRVFDHTEYVNSELVKKEKERNQVLSEKYGEDFAEVRYNLESTKVYRYGEIQDNGPSVFSGVSYYTITLNKHRNPEAYKEAVRDILIYETKETIDKALESDAFTLVVEVSITSLDNTIHKEKDIKDTVLLKELDYANTIYSSDFYLKPVFNQYFIIEENRWVPVDSSIEENHKILSTESNYLKMADSLLKEYGYDNSENFPITPPFIGFGDKEKSQITIVNEQEFYTISGVKRDAKTKKPLKGMQVTLIDALTGNSLATAETDEYGRFVFENIPLGSYILKETKAPEGYKNDSVDVRVKVNGKDISGVVFENSPLPMKIKPKQENHKINTSAQDAKFFSVERVVGLSLLFIAAGLAILDIKKNNINKKEG